MAYAPTSNPGFKQNFIINTNDNAGSQAHPIINNEALSLNANTNKFINKMKAGKMMRM